MRVGVINYGVGNLGSILRALEEIRVTPVLVSRATEMRNADCLILPGVGNFADCARKLETGGWKLALQEEVLDRGRSLLGVCVGMQLLADSSTEGAVGGESTPGLGLIPGQVRHLSSFGCSLRIPHVGWNSVIHSQNSLFDGLADGTDFYFVHSYAFALQHGSDLLATTDYDVTVTAAVRRGNVWGTQFHPEKSSQAGIRVLHNFIKAVGC